LTHSSILANAKTRDAMVDIRMHRLTCLTVTAISVTAHWGLGDATTIFQQCSSPEKSPTFGWSVKQIKLTQFHIIWTRLPANTGQESTTVLNALSL